MNEPAAEVDPPIKKRSSSWPKPGAKRKIGHRATCALLEIIHRKKLNWTVDYKGVAAGFAVSWQSLKQNYVLWKRGFIDMGGADSPQQVAVDMRTQFEEQMTLMLECKQMALNSLRAVMLLAREDAANGEALAPITRGVPRALSYLAKVGGMIKETEKGYNAVLEDARMARAGLEKPVTGSVLPPDVKAGMVSANDSQLAIAALDAPDDTPEG